MKTTYKNILCTNNGRLGDQLTILIAKLCSHYHIGEEVHAVPIKYNSFFLKSLQDILKELDNGERYDKYLEDTFKKAKHQIRYPIPKSVKIIQEDIRTNFRKTKIYKKWRNSILEKVTVPDTFNPQTTIAVHVRLGDVANKKNHNGDLQIQGFEHILKHINDNSYNPTIANKTSINKQSPISEDVLNKIINQAKKDFPEHEVIVFQESNGPQNKLPYRQMRNSVDVDLTCLLLSDVLIGAHSNFSVTALIFNEGTRAYIPSWGHYAYSGFGTKYDKNTNITLFNSKTGSIIK